MKLFQDQKESSMRRTAIRRELVAGDDLPTRPALRLIHPVLRIVSQPLSPEPAGRARFGFFASAFRARKAVRIARIGNSH